jgi:hypothetical protein
MLLPSRLCAVALVAAALGGCQALGGGGGVMPETEVGPPPSMRGAVPAPQRGRSARVDPDDAAPQTTPTRRLNLPNASGQTRAAANEERRIRREDIEGETTSRSGSGGIAPQMSQGGGVGLGGKF